MNPALDERTFERERAAAATAAGGAGAGTYHPPITDGPVSPWQGYQAMTVGGVAVATGLLFVVLLATAVVGWSSVTPPTEVRAASAPGWLFLAVLGGLGVAIATIFKPKWARFTAPLYAAIEGLVLGAISRLFEAQFPGIVLQAVCLTLAVFALMWVAFATRLIKVTQRLRVGIVVATGAVMVVYLVGWVVQLFGGTVSFISEPTTFGILFSLAVVGIAAFNLLLDFDFVQRNVDRGAPSYLNWHAAFGLLVTLIWLYLELLRLLAKLQGRD